MQQYNLKEINKTLSNEKPWKSAGQFLSGEYSKILTAFFAVLINAGTNIATPILISVAIDTYINTGDLEGLNLILVFLGVMYLTTMTVSFLQTRLVGYISQRFLYRLRQNLFAKVQTLPLTFFQQNKTGDIITRINNDTDKLNNFLSGIVFQFVSNLFTFVGIGVFIFFLNWQLSLVVWIAVFFVVAISRIISPFVESKNKESLAASSEITSFLDENFNNFKALVAFNKGQYLQDSFDKLNQANFKKNSISHILNSFFNPLYSFAGNMAQVMVLAFGLYLLNQGDLTIGLLVGFISYTQRFYEPLRSLGNIWGTLQETLAAWSRVKTLLHVK